MIVKENLNVTPQDKFEKAGFDAERKVAYYLKMAFGDEPALLILHDLRVELEDGITAQMDHLVIHQHGLIIIESKSVAGKLQAQEDGQWIRWYSQKLGKDISKGMENPIKQASRQGQTLKKVLWLKASNDVTRNAIQALPVDVLVTFSTINGGVFITKNRELYPEVCPADAVDDNIDRIVLHRAKVAQAQDFRLSEGYRAQLAEYLIKIHKPYKENNVIVEQSYLNTSVTEEPAKVEEKTSVYKVAEKPKPTSIIGQIKESIQGSLAIKSSKFRHACLKCKSDKVEIRFGNNYYLKCLICDANNRIDATCAKCKSVFKIRKDKKNFFAECLTCKTSELFHSNT